MPIDVEVQAILDRLAAAKLEDLSSLSPAAAREVSAGLARASPPRATSGSCAKSDGIGSRRRRSPPALPSGGTAACAHRELGELIMSVTLRSVPLCKRRISTL